MRKFQALKPVEFVQLVANYPWTRRITEVHLHHTWRPRQADYRGLATIEAMWRYHTQQSGWQDIAQHVSIAPDGTIWVGRNFNWAPASAKGFNGNSAAGPFMIEMIGDFDKGRESLSQAQKDATLSVIAAVQRRFELGAAALRFHKEMAAKTCPGTSQDKPSWIKEIAAFALPDPAAAAERSAFPTHGAASYDIIARMTPHAAQQEDMSDAEHPLELPEPAERDARGLFDAPIDPLILDALRNHIINLAEGQFSDDGIVSTDQGDVDRIFDDCIVGEIAAARDAKRPARILIYAHGGLVDERSALLGAYDQLRFWEKNGVYPVFFIWETGLAETLKQMLSGSRGISETPRGALRDWADDRVEDSVRFFGADKIWSAMKRSAELAGAAGGGAAYVAAKLAALQKANPDGLEIHMAGHSAGSIFATHFLRALDGKTPVKTAHFLAPAISTDLFLNGFAPAMGVQVQDLTIYTMTKTRELDDTVTPLYGKSLLYMVHGALEPKRDAGILGLEISLRGNPALKKLFGLGGSASANARIIWSPSDDADTGSASESTTHGGFDNDGPTLESVCRRITARVKGQPIEPYKASRSRGSLWDGPPVLPEHLRGYLGAHSPANLATPSDVTQGSSVPGDCGATAATSSTTAAPIAMRRRALLCGIDKYRHINPLHGCVNDVNQWKDALVGLGYQTEQLLNGDATSQAILARLRAFISSARAGDSLVFQYSGHGTLFADEDGDEASGNDSAICAVDCGNEAGVGGLVLDDELYEAVKLLPSGAKLTFFMDCCHSGTVTRAMAVPPPAAPSANSIPRYVRPSPAMKLAYRALKQSRSARTFADNANGPATRELIGDTRLVGIQFAACKDEQVAYETNGSGDFSRLTVPMLANGRSLSNRGFHDRIIKAFGSNARQMPILYCHPDVFDSPMAI